MSALSIRGAGLAIATGLLLAVAFPLGPLPGGVVTDGWWPAGWIGLTPLLVAAVAAGTRRRAAALGLVSGAIAFGAILSWLHPFLRRWGGLSWGVAAAILGLLVIYLAAYTAAFAAFVRHIAARWGAPVACLLAPAAWTGLELARGRLLTGFPWCLLGYSQAGVPPAIQTADLAGVYGVSFTLVAASALFALPLVPTAGLGGELPRGPAAALLSLVVIGALSYGFLRERAVDRIPGSIAVGIVQANVAQPDKWDPDESDRIEHDHFRMTRDAALRGAALVIWAESSVPLSVTRHADYAARLEALARETHVEIVAGSVAYGRRDGQAVPYNSAFLVRPEEGLDARYDKRHLVPFGEYVPLARLLYFVEPMVHEAGDFEAGSSPDPLPAQGIVLAPLICYEAIFPELARASILQGGEAIVNLTNDAWYGDTAMPLQHLQHTVLRAVESRRFLLRAANTGISAIIDPTGRIEARTTLDEPAVLEGRISPRSGATLYLATGDAFAWACVILGALAITAAGRPDPRRNPPHHATR